MKLNYLTAFYYKSGQMLKEVFKIAKNEVN